MHQQKPLREILDDALPKVLPRGEENAITGTALVPKINEILPDRFSVSTLRYHLSMKSADPTSCVAKRSKGQGYYFREEHDRAMPPEVWKTLVAIKNAAKELSAVVFEAIANKDTAEPETWMTLRDLADEIEKEL